MYLPARLSFLSSRALSPAAGLLGSLGRHSAYLRQLHELCAQAPRLTGPELVAALLARLAIRVEYDPADLRRLPAPGAFLAVANQPGSLLNSLVVLHVLGQARPELRALVEQELAPLLPQLTAHCVVPDYPAAGPAGPGLRRLLRLLHNDVPLVVFPARSATSFPAVAERLLTTLRLPVVPLWLSSRPGPTAWWAALPLLLRRPAGLPGELLDLRGTTVQVRLGPAVAAPVLHGLPAAARLPYLRARIEALGTGGAAEADQAAPTPAAPAEADYRLLEADLAALPAPRRVVRCRQWEVYVAKGGEIPHVLREIRRLRARTLAAAGADCPAPGEQQLDDACHRHLFLYDRRARRLVAACRLGHGKRILRGQGRRGFRLHRFFKLGGGVSALLHQSLELSQAFVQADYQGQLLPLGLVWEGLAQYLRARPHYRYLLGSVNLSHHLPAVPKATVAAFIQEHCLGPEAAHLRPRRAVRYRTLPWLPAASPAAEADPEQLLQDLMGSLEPGGMGVPARLRPYFRQQARFLGLHLDPAGSALHGVVVLDTSALADYTYRLGERGGELLA